MKITIEAIESDRQRSRSESEDDSLFTHCQKDHWNYFVFIRDFGWLSFATLKIEDTEWVRLIEPAFITNTSFECLDGYLKKHIFHSVNERGLSVRKENIIFLISASS